MKSLKLNITDSKLKVNEIRQSRNNKNVTEMLVLPEKTTTTKLMIKAFNKIQHLFMIKKKTSWQTRNRGEHLHLD